MQTSSFKVAEKGNPKRTRSFRVYQLICHSFEFRCPVIFPILPAEFHSENFSGSISRLGETKIKNQNWVVSQSFSKHFLAFWWFSDKPQTINSRLERGNLLKSTDKSHFPSDCSTLIYLWSPGGSRYCDSFINSAVRWYPVNNNSHSSNHCNSFIKRKRDQLSDFFSFNLMRSESISPMNEPDDIFVVFKRINDL